MTVLIPSLFNIYHMRWLKYYEDYKDYIYYNDSPFPLFFYTSNGKDGYRNGEIILKDEVIEKINKFNEVFKYIGICIEMPIKENTNPSYPNGQKFIFNLDIDLLSAKPAAQPDTYFTIFNRAIEYYAKSENGVSSATFIIKIIKILAEYKITFAIDIDDTTSITSNTKQQFKIHEYKRIRANTLDNFIQIIVKTFYDYLLENKTDYIHANLAGMGLKTTEIEAPFIIKTVLKCLSEWNTLTKERIAEIFFNEIRNRTDCNNLLHTMRDTEWYNMFINIDREAVEISADMVKGGFND